MKGSIHVTSDVGIQSILEEVLYCFEVLYNLLSVLNMQRARLSIVFNQNGAKVKDKRDKILMRGTKLKIKVI